jgi:hypothetical protein
LLKFEVGTGLAPDTALYRYLSLEAFLGLIESRSLRLANVNDWDDPGEAILGKVPTGGMDGNIETPLYSFHQLIYGSCWSRLRESDAMWRIYSPNRTGVQIASSVEKFGSISGVRRALLAEVMYFNTREELVANASKVTDSLGEALHKRTAFRHEEEVRFLTHSDFIEGPRIGPRPFRVALAIEPRTFIEGIVLDPRAAAWYVDDLTNYCRRAGLAVEPVKSSLYESDPQLKIGLERRWVPKSRT